MCYLVWLAVWLLAAAGCVTVKVSLFEEPGPLKEKTLSGYGRDKILLMEVAGVILEGPHRLLGVTKGVTSPSRIKEELEKAAKDDRIKAVVLKINSPGGTVSAADVILHELKAFKATTGVPVVVCLQGLAASGGYYVAQAGDTIIAYPTCITGSIGVIAMKFNLRGLMDKVGVDEDVVKSGQWKDFWSPFRPASPQEKEMMQQVIDDFYRRFCGRGGPGAEVEPEKDPGSGRRPDLYRLPGPGPGSGGSVGLPGRCPGVGQGQGGPGRARVITYHRPGSYKPTIYSLLPDLDMVGPQFLYLWWAGST